MEILALILFGLAFASAADYDPVVQKLDDGARYQYVEGPDGTPHLVDLWLKASDAAESARYDAEKTNTYHLFSKANPSLSQPIIMGNSTSLTSSNYNATRRTIMLIHGWLDKATSDFNTVLVPAILAREDVNVIVVDWSAGADTVNYGAAVANTPIAGAAVARFVTWLNNETGSTLNNYHLIGHSLGGHQVGIVGRRLGGQVAYITVLDASLPGWLNNHEKFNKTDGLYTEVIHTNAGVTGYLANLGQVDFYPNGGVDMPGCISPDCSHKRSFHYMAESIRTGGFTGSKCASYIAAIAGQCLFGAHLQMGGLTPKTGQTGIYYLRTNALPPFSRG